MTIFSRTADLAGVARRLHELAPSVDIDGPDNDWRNATVSFGRLWKKRKLTLTHDPAWYAEPNWSAQMKGMQAYLSHFPETEGKDKALSLTTTFRFSLGTRFQPEFTPDGDPRLLGIVFAVTELLDGVVFTPSSLRDGRGRVLVSSARDLEEDPEAVWPRVIGEVSVQEPMGAAAHEESRPIAPGEDVATSEPPTAERVARRTLALKAVTKRAILEQDPTSNASKRTFQDVLRWIDEVGLQDELEPDEWEVLQRPPGRLDPQAQINSTWRLEGLVVLAWALGRFDIPPHDQLVSPGALWKSLGLLTVQDARALLSKPTLHSRDQVRVLRNRLFGLHWRLRNYRIHRTLVDFADFSKTCWFGPLDVSGLPLVDGDLALNGKRLDRASEETFASALSASLERHKAVNWLWAGPERYSQASEAT
jgi:hypothetical protein